MTTSCGVSGSMDDLRVAQQHLIAARAAARRPRPGRPRRLTATTSPLGVSSMTSVDNVLAQMSLEEKAALLGSHAL